jgi:hypothetical protein
VKIRSVEARGLTPATPRSRQYDRCGHRFDGMMG